MENRFLLTNMFKKYERVFAACATVGLLIVSRVLPHLPNVTPLTGIALFGARYQSKLYAFVVPLIALFLSDLLLGFHSTIVFVYASFVLSSYIGLLMRRLNFLQYITLASVISSLQFFLITNLGVFLTTPLYEKNIEGLLNCYIAALPFFRNSLFGDLFYTAILCSFYELCRTLLNGKKSILIYKDIFHNR